MSNPPTPDLTITSYTTNAAGRHTYRDEFGINWPDSSFSKKVRAQLDKLTNKADKTPGARSLRRDLPLYRLDGEGQPLSWGELPETDARKRRYSASSVSSLTIPAKKVPTGPTYTTVFEGALLHAFFKPEGNGRLLTLYHELDFVKPAWQVKFTCQPQVLDVLDSIFRKIVPASETTADAVQIKHRCDKLKNVMAGRVQIIGKDAPGKPREHFLYFQQPLQRGPAGIEIGPLFRRGKGRNHSKNRQLEDSPDPNHETRVRQRLASFKGPIFVVHGVREGKILLKEDALKEPWVYTAMQQARNAK